MSDIRARTRHLHYRHGGLLLIAASGRRG
jgi:hypothetical protein